jgi:hypothetical protein
MTYTKKMQPNEFLRFQEIILKLVNLQLTDFHDKTYQLVMVEYYRKKLVQFTFLKDKPEHTISLNLLEIRAFFWLTRTEEDYEIRVWRGEMHAKFLA